MAYKPGKRNVDIYAKYDKKKNKPTNYSNIKLFGFRTGAPYKVVLATFYYIAALLLIISSVAGEVLHYSFEPVDYVLMVSKYIFITILLFSPALFLSDFKYIEKIPFFNRKNAYDNVKGLILVAMICVGMFQLDIYVMSDKWKDSRDRYTQVLQNEANKNAQKKTEDKSKDNSRDKSKDKSTDNKNTTTKTNKSTDK